MSVEFPMRRSGLTLVLASPAFADEFERLPEGVDLMVARPRRSRSPQQHAWVWAALSAICNAGAWDGDPESLLRYIKLRTNYGDWFPLSNGRAVFVPRSISFAACDQTDFDAFVRNMEKCLAEHLQVDVGTVFDDADRATGTKRGIRPERQNDTPEATSAGAKEGALSLEDRLTALAVSLDWCETSVELDKKWAEVKARTETRELYRAAPAAVEGIVAASRNYARGRFDRRQLNDAVERAISGAKERKAA